MRKVIVSTFVTLDGVMQDPGGVGEIEEGGWEMPFFNEQSGEYASELLFSSDALLLGRVTYEGFAKAWPELEEIEGEFAVRMNSLPKYVASTTLEEPLEWNANLIKGDVAEEVAKLKQQPGDNILILASAPLMHTLMKHDLIDEFHIWVNPIVLGTGKRLFDGAYGKSELELVDTATFDTGVVVLAYRPATSDVQPEVGADAGEAVKA